MVNEKYPYRSEVPFLHNVHVVSNMKIIYMYVFDIIPATLFIQF